MGFALIAHSDGARKRSTVLTLGRRCGTVRYGLRLSKHQGGWWEQLFRFAQGLPASSIPGVRTVRAGTERVETGFGQRRPRRPAAPWECKGEAVVLAGPRKSRTIKGNPMRPAKTLTVGAPCPTASAAKAGPYLLPTPYSSRRSWPSEVAGRAKTSDEGTPHGYLTRGSSGCRRRHD